MANCAVSGTLVDSGSNAVSGATVRFNVIAPISTSTLASTLFVPTEISTTSASNGSWTLNITQGLSGILSIDYPPNSTDSTRRYTYSIVIPSQSTATINSLITET